MDFKLTFSIILSLFLLICLKASAQEFNESNKENNCIIPLNSIDESRYTFVSVEEYSIKLDSIGVTTIELFTLPNWTDPGDYHKVRISNEKYTQEFSNLDGWVRFDENYTVAQNLKDLNQLESDLVLLSKGEINLLILFGWAYASQPGLCTIIDLENGELIMNLNVELKDISKNGIGITISAVVSTSCPSGIIRDKD